MKKLFGKYVSLLLLAVLLSGLCASAVAEGNWANILLLGCDSYTKDEYSRSDSMIILSVNDTTNEIKMTSLMRDTWIKDPKTGKYRKLTELCALGGPQRTIKAINQSFGMDIEKYALISMKGVATIIDMLGGIELDVTEQERRALNKGLFDLSTAENSGHMTKLNESGENVHLNGNQATAFARIRKIDSDYVRVERQRVVLTKMAEKLRNGTSAATLLPVINTLCSFVDTNLSLPEMLQLGTIGLNCDMDAIREFRVPADNTFQSGTFNGIWCIKPNFDKNKKLLHEFIYG